MNEKLGVPWRHKYCNIDAYFQQKQLHKLLFISNNSSPYTCLLYFLDEGIYFSKQTRHWVGMKPDWDSGIALYACQRRQPYFDWNLVWPKEMSAK